MKPCLRMTTMAGLFWVVTAPVWATSLGTPGTAPAPTDLPTGGQVAAGNAAITTNGAAMTVTTGASRTVMTWNSFNIGSSAQVHFAQPGSSSAVLNRVTGGEASQIMGSLSSNGSVFLLNPNGVLIGSGAQVSLPSITINTSASTPSDADFLNGLDSAFHTPSYPGGDFVLDGNLVATGSVVLAIGGTMTINGSLSANNVIINCATCALNPPDVISIGRPGDISVSLPPGFFEGTEGTVISEGGVISVPTASVISSAVLSLSGASLQSGQATPLITLSPSAGQGMANRGQIRSVGGEVQITPQGSLEIMGSLVNSGGLTNATTLTVSGGSISIGL